MLTLKFIEFLKLINYSSNSNTGNDTVLISEPNLHNIRCL